MAKLILTLSDGTLEHELNADETTIGRSSSNTLVVPDGSVSSRHAKIVRREGKFFLEDLGSTNGSFLNGDQVKSAPLDHGDKVLLGAVEGRFDNGESDSETPRPKPPRALPKEPKHAPPPPA